MKLSSLSLLLVGLAAPILSLSAAHPSDEPETTAVWKDQRIDFYYRSSTAIYSCSALQGRIISILRTVGARDDLKVDTSGCDVMLSPPAQTMPSIPGRRTRSDDMFRNKSSRGEQYSHVRIFVKTPTEATPEVLAELQKDKPRRELIAKVTGKPDAVVEGETQFPAQWQRITLSRDSIGLEAAECELLDQLSSTVFRDLGVRVVSRDYSCTPGQTSKIPPKITVDALIPALKVSVPEIDPAESDSDPSESGAENADEHGTSAGEVQAPAK
ncbi:MAG TPA: hypothetical protein VFS24_01220 [Steroidobacteraceae bacterium]|nr:hypothetical protein [Steroidobacteraceae bacterium]